MDIMEFHELLIYLTGGKDPIATRKEIAFHMGRDYQTVTNYVKGDTIPDIDAVRRLHHWLVKEKSCHIVCKYMNPTLSGESNGKVQDDLWNLHEQSTDAARYYEAAKNGDPQSKQKYFDEIKKMEKEVKDLKAEGEEL